MTNIPAINSEESTRLYHIVRSLANDFAPGQRRSIFNDLVRFAAQGCYDRDVHGIHGFIRQAEVALIARTELVPDVDVVTAILFYRPVYKGLCRADDLLPTYGAGAIRLIKLLNQASSLYMKTTATGQENFSHLLLATGQDIRVILMLLADRLYLLRIAGKTLPKDDCLRLADEVTSLYAPLAHKLGLYKIKSEMEDLTLKYSDRRTFDFIKRKLGETKRAREAYIARFIEPLEARIQREIPTLEFSVKGRTKSIRSINNKLKKQNIPFEDIYDLFAIRIIFELPPEEERTACWRIYSIVTDMYRPNPNRLKDWVSIPKSNGYESLHITVMGSENHWVEVQIRSRRMDEVAERGVAAHWRYKGVRSETGLDDYMTSVRETLEDAGYGTPAGAVSPAGRIDIYDDEIYVFTPKGRVVRLPRGATVLDFAYAIHTRVGETAIGARLGGKNMPIRHKLQNGDVIEVITSPQQTPKKDWLRIAVSARARTKIRASLRAETEAGPAMARETLERRLKNRKLPWREDVFTRLIHRKGFKSLTDFLVELSAERIDAGSVVDEYAAECRLSEMREQPVSGAVRSAADYVPDIDRRIVGKGGKDTAERDNTPVIGEGVTGLQYSFARCCHPVFGDEVFGFVSGNTLKIHRRDCPNAPDMINKRSERVISVRWNADPQTGCRVRLSVVGKDDIGIISTIAGVIGEETGKGLKHYSIDSADGLFRAQFTIEVIGRGMLASLMGKLQRTPGVKSVSRL